MKSFKQYIAEARITTREEIVAVIAKHKKAGEILNPEYQDLGSQARRVFGGDTRHVRELILKHMHAGNRSEELSDFYYSWPDDSFVSLNKAAKLLTKLKDVKLKDVITDGNDVIKKWQPIAADLKDLKGKVVKVTQKRAETKAAAEKIMTKKMADSSSLIKIFESHMKEYITMAEQRAKEFVENKLDALKKHDWDLNKLAPRPRSNMSREEYKQADNKRGLYTSITKSESESSMALRTGPTDIRVPNKVMIDHYIEMNKKEAEAAYRSFMEKMIQKIGKPVVDAKMTGNIWTNAVLHVTTDDGEDQSWKTQMILNFSKYQRMFNQFPTKRIK